MAAVIVEVANAVVSELNDKTNNTFSQTFNAKRSWADWSEKLEEEDKLSVDVVPTQRGYTETDATSRASLEHTIQIDIGVRQRFGPTKQTTDKGRIDRVQIDGMVLLLQEIAEHFMVDRLASYDSARWESTRILGTYNKKMLRELRQYFGFVRLQFEVDKDLPSERDTV